jgi:hypothetical protein
VRVTGDEATGGAGHDPASAATPTAGDAIPRQPGPIVPGDTAASDATADALALLATDDLEPAQRRQALGQVVAGLRQRGFGDFFKPKAALSWIADTVVDVAPRIPVRNLETLRRHFPGLDDMQIATRLVRNAARTSAGIGAVGGGVSAVEWVAPPALLTQPVLLAAETVAVVAVEIKLIGELQELYGQPVPGGPVPQAASLLQAWSGRRGVNLLMIPGGGLAGVLGTATRKQMRDQLARRFGRSLATLGPFLTGAAIAAYLNRRGTLKLAEDVRKDLVTRIPRQVTRGK